MTATTDGTTPTTRELLAQAVSAVHGLEATEYHNGSTLPGTAWPRLERIDYPNRFGGVAHWNLILVLPQDIKHSEQYLEHNLPLVLAAVGPHIKVTSVTPQRLQIDGVGTLLVAFFNGHREAD